jgi:hypothetical protein
MREFLLRTLSSLSDAPISAQWREHWILPTVLDHDRSRQTQCQRTAKARFALEALDKDLPGKFAATLNDYIDMQKKN